MTGFVRGKVAVILAPHHAGWRIIGRGLATILSPVTTEPLANVNVAGMEDMPTPDAVQARVPLSARAAETVAHGRASVRAILDRKDPRLFVVVGPCSIHDPRAALEYAGRLARLAERVRDTLHVVMRVYF